VARRELTILGPSMVACALQYIVTDPDLNSAYFMLRVPAGILGAFFASKDYFQLPCVQTFGEL
jgi:hypothetical protein